MLDRRRKTDWLADRKIVAIFKQKGSTKLPTNYTPIALLHAFYNFYTLLIDKRLRILEHRVWRMQVGFRRDHWWRKFSSAPTHGTRASMATFSDLFLISSRSLPPRQADIYGIFCSAEIFATSLHQGRDLFAHLLFHFFAAQLLFVFLVLREEFA